MKKYLALALVANCHFCASHHYDGIRSRDYQQHQQILRFDHHPHRCHGSARSAAA